MKNLLKTSFLALTIAVSFAACKGKASATSADSAGTDSSTKTVVDTMKKDTSTMPDSLKKDTMIKTTTVKTSSKTSVNKKQ